MQWQPDHNFDVSLTYPPSWVGTLIAEKINSKNLGQKPVGSKLAGGSRIPGIDYGLKTDWPEVLPGWTYSRDGKYLCRPGGTGITGMFTEAGNLYIFSTNAAPFEAGKSYSKIAAYTTLYHNGDFRAAAYELRKQGFGQ